MNSFFRPERILSMIDEMQAVLAPEAQEFINRWRALGGSIYAWNQQVEVMREFAVNRPAHMRQHIISHFNLDGTATVVLDTTGDDAWPRSHLRINSIAIHPDTPGVDEDPYPWSGVYFAGVPIEIEALPAPRTRFVGWLEFPQETSTTLTLIPDLATTITALFEPLTATGLAFADLHPAGQTGWPHPAVAVEVRLDNGAHDDLSTATVALEILDGPGTLGGTLARAASGGVAVFDDLVFSAPGRYALRAVATGLTAADSPEIEIAALEKIVAPQFLQGAQPDNNDRVPYVFRAEIEGLRPDATYRFANRFVDADDPPTQNGAGNALYYRPDSATFHRTTATPDFADPDTHGEFTTDATGRYAGWFVAEPSGNRRFAPGNTVRPRLLLNDGAEGGSYHFFLTLAAPVSVLEFGDAPHQATAVRGESPFAPRNVVLLFDNAEGAGRPLAATLVEDDGAPTDNRYADFYRDLVDGRDGAWGTLVPNLLPSGVRRIEEHSLVSAMAIRSYATPAGVWFTPDGDTHTATPSGGAETPLYIPLQSKRSLLWISY